MSEFFRVLFKSMRDQNTASKFSAHWSTMTVWQHKHKKASK